MTKLAAARRTLSASDQAGAIFGRQVHLVDRVVQFCENVTECAAFHEVCR